MGNTRETAELEIRLKSEQTQAELKAIGERMKILNQQKKDLAKVGYSATPEITKELTELKSRKDALNKSFKESLTVIINGEVAGKSLASLQAAYRKLNAERMKMASNTDEFKNATSGLKNIQTEINRLNAPLKTTTGFWQGLGQEVKKFGILAAGYLGFQFLSSQITNIISKNSKLSDSLADIQRVAGLTRNEALLLNTQLSKIDTRTGTQELRNIAIVAGKLGIAKGDIYDFTKSVDQLVVSLGDELGDADQITTQLGKILNVFKGKITADDLSHLGNAFVELANNGVATGAFLADFTQRVSSTAKAVNLSLGATVGLAAGFEELGLRSESSSTALEKVLRKIGTDIPAAAKIAGMDLKKFNELFDKAPQEALIAYAQGLVKNKESFSEIALSFQDTEDKGSAVIKTLTSIGQNSEFMRAKIDLGNKSMTESGAIMEAYALKNETLGAKLEKLGKALYGAFSNPVVTATIDKLITLFGKLAPAQESVAQSGARVVNSNNAQIAKARELLKEYDQLSSSHEKSIETQERMRVIALSLKDTIGSSAVSVNEETKAITLNREAVVSAINEKDKANVKEIANLGKRASALDKTYIDDKARVINNNALLDLEIEKLKELHITQTYAANAKTNDDLDKGRITGSYGEEGLKAVIAYQEALKKLEAANTSLLSKRKEMSEIQKQILAFGYSVDDVKRIGEQLSAEQAKALIKPGDDTGGSKDELSKSELSEYRKKMQELYKYLDERITTITTFGEAEEAAWRDRGESFLTTQQLSNLMELEDQEKHSKAMLDVATAGSEEETTAREEHRLALNKIENFWNSKDVQDTVKAEKLKNSELADVRNEGLETQLKEEMEGIRLRLHLVEKGSEEEKALKIKLVEDEFAIAIEGVDKESQAYLDAVIKRNEAIDAINKEHAETLKQQALEQIGAVKQTLETATQLYGEYNNLLTMRENNQTTKARNEAAKRKHILDDQLRHGVISQEQYNKQIDAINQGADAKETEIRKKQFERNKKLQIAQIAINTASAIMQIWAAYGENYYLAAALSLGVGFIGAAQIFAVEDQEFPEYGEGGILKGPKHKDPEKGIDLRDSSGRTFARAEGGELIVPSDFVDNNPDLVDKILASKGGKLNIGAADGKGLVNLNEPLEPGDLRIGINPNALPQFNPVSISQSVNSFGSGVSSTGGTKGEPSDGKGLVNFTEPATPGDLRMYHQIILQQSEKIDLLIDKLENLKIEFVERDYKKFKERIALAERQSTV